MWAGYPWPHPVTTRRVTYGPWGVFCTNWPVSREPLRLLWVLSVFSCLKMLFIYLVWFQYLIDQWSVCFWPVPVSVCMLDLTLATLQTPAVNHPREDLLSDNAVTVMNFQCVSVSVHACMHVRVCEFACMSACMCVCMRVCVCVWDPTVSMLPCVCVRVCVCVCERVGVCGGVWVCVCVCDQACMLKREQSKTNE